MGVVPAWPTGPSTCPTNNPPSFTDGGLIVFVFVLVLLPVDWGVRRRVRPV